MTGWRWETGSAAECRPSLLLKRISAPSASSSRLATALTQAAVCPAPPGTSETASVAPVASSAPGASSAYFSQRELLNIALVSKIATQMTTNLVA